MEHYSEEHKDLQPTSSRRAFESFAPLFFELLAPNVKITPFESAVIFHPDYFIGRLRAGLPMAEQFPFLSPRPKKASLLELEDRPASTNSFLTHPFFRVPQG